MKLSICRSPGPLSLDGQLVAEGQVQVVVDGVPQGYAETEVVEFLPLGDAIDTRLAAAVPRRVEGTPELFREVAGQVGVQLEHRIGLQGLPDIIGVVAEYPDGRQELQRRAPARHPVAELPDHGQADTAIPAILADVERLAAVVLADRQCQVSEQVNREARLVTQGVGDVLLCRRADEIDAEFEHRIAESAGRLVERPASHGHVARDSPHRHDDCSNGGAVQQREGVRVTDQGHGRVEIRAGRHGMGRVERIGVAAHRIDDDRHRIRITQPAGRSVPASVPAPPVGRAYRRPSEKRQPSGTSVSCS